ncbi:alpha/beta fold hydrolase [Mangrovimonas xylaniphaga]|uniref:alpha/beta fold hydrolase n=1 Tax=Mangrovimonas xylaniphaga TaxID=1645915 RepID=UPI0006B65E8D|nr:alpha/beta hydrolase [Mangrovimonas xylaniphaga]
MTIQYKEISVHFEVSGEGKPVVLLHGFLENSKMWQHLTKTLNATCKVIAIDLLGHGETECLGYIHTMEDMAEMVCVVLDHLGVSEATVIGHSMGGYVALALAELYPDKISALCLLNSTAEADSEERQLNRDRAVKAVKQNYKAFVSMAIANLFAEDNRERLSESIAQVRSEALKTPLQGIVAALEGMKVRKDRREQFVNGSYKKLLVIGLKDPVLDYESVMAYVANSNIEVVEFPDGHMSYIEDKEELDYKILQFIEK